MVVWTLGVGWTYQQLGVEWVHQRLGVGWTCQRLAVASKPLAAHIVPRDLLPAPLLVRRQAAQVVL